MDVTTAVEDQGSPLVIDHGDTRTVDEGQAAQSDVSELQRHKEARGLVKAPEKIEEPAPLPDAPEQAKPEEKKPDRWSDPDTGDTYDMRHKVARRVKKLLEERGSARAEVEQLRREKDDLTRRLIEGGATPRQAERKAEQVMADADPEPDPANVEKYPEGQFDKAFMRDMGRWAARQETKTQFDTARTQAQAHQRQQDEVRQVQAWQGTVPDARKKYSDFDEVLNQIPNTPENAPIVRLMMGSEVGNDVVYYLGKNAEAMRAYQTATPENKMRLLYHIEAQVIQANRAASSRVAASTTRAPQPTSPVNTGAGAAQGPDWSRTDDPDQYARYKAMRQTRR